MVGTINTICDNAPSASNPGDQPEESPSKRARIGEVIAFTEEDLQEVRIPHDDPVIILLTIANFNVKRILVDNGSSADILYYDAFQKIKLPCNQILPISAPLVGFIRSSVPVTSQLLISTKMGLNI